MPCVLVLDDAHAARAAAGRRRLCARCAATRRRARPGARRVRRIRRPRHVLRDTCRLRDAQRIIEGLRARTATLQVKLLPDGTLPLLAAQIPDRASSKYAAGCVRGAVVVRHAVQALARCRRALRRQRCWLSSLPRALKLWQLHKAEQAARRADHAKIFNQLLPGQPIVDARAQLEGVLSRVGRRQQCAAAGHFTARAGHGAGARRRASKA